MVMPLLTRSSKGKLKITNITVHVYFEMGKDSGRFDYKKCIDKADDKTILKFIKKAIKNINSDQTQIVKIEVDLA